MRCRSFLSLCLALVFAVSITPGIGNFIDPANGDSCACVSACLCHTGGACALPAEDSAHATLASKQINSKKYTGPAVSLPDNIPVIGPKSCGCGGVGTHLSASSVNLLVSQGSDSFLHRLTFKMTFPSAAPRIWRQILEPPPPESLSVSS